MRLSTFQLLFCFPSKILILSKRVARTLPIMGCLKVGGSRSNVSIFGTNNEISLGNRKKSPASISNKPLPLQDGTKFDSSVDRGQPFQFQIGVGQVIKGWDEGVLKMSVGEKSILRISADFGYGMHTSPPP